VRLQSMWKAFWNHSRSAAGEFEVISMAKFYGCDSRLFGNAERFLPPPDRSDVRNASGHHISEPGQGDYLVGRLGARGTEPQDPRTINFHGHGTLQQGD